MFDYENMFAKNVYEQTKGKVQGKVTAYVRDNVLHVKVENYNFKFERTYDDFANRIMNGFSSQFAVYDFCKVYNKFIRNRFFR